MREINLFKAPSDFSGLRKNLVHRSLSTKEKKLPKGTLRRRKLFKKPSYPSFVALTKDMLGSEEWQSGLSSSEKILYIHLKYKYIGSNNGKIDLHYSELERMMAPATISKAFKGLLANGWVEKTKQGGLYRYSNLYKLTGKYDSALVNYRN